MFGFAWNCRLMLIGALELVLDTVAMTTGETATCPFEDVSCASKMSDLSTMTILKDWIPLKNLSSRNAPAEMGVLSNELRVSLLTAEPPTLLWNTAPRKTVEPCITGCERIYVTVVLESIVVFCSLVTRVSISATSKVSFILDAVSPFNVATK